MSPNSSAPEPGKQTPELVVLEGGLVIGALALAQSIYPIGSDVFIVKTFIAGAAKAKLARNEVKIKSVFFIFVLSLKKLKMGIHYPLK
tara:strand:+ start:31 stop:294 length:264 start_codon:yes stop_codon:yes gene_type:complete